MWPHDCLCKVSKILAEFNKVFNFEKFLIYVKPKFNWSLINAYNCKFCNLKTEFNVTNVSSYKFLSIFSNWLTLSACHRLLITFTDEILCFYCTSSFALRMYLPHAADLYLYKNWCAWFILHILACTGRDYNTLEPQVIREITCDQCCFCLQHNIFVRGQEFFINHLYGANTFFSAIIHRAGTFCDVSFQISPAPYNA